MVVHKRYQESTEIFLKVCLLPQALVIWRWFDMEETGFCLSLLTSWDLAPVSRLLGVMLQGSWPGSPWLATRAWWALTAPGWLRASGTLALGVMLGV